jgi:hypothetical protein
MNASEDHTPKVVVSAELATFDTFNREALVVLQARDVPRFRAADLFSKIDELRASEEEAALDQELVRWDAYLATFAKLTDGKCLCCGTSLRCPLGMGIFGGFEWGMVHGEGHCSHCGYPMRGHHRVKDLGKIDNLFLPYHPSELSFEPKDVT